MPTQEPILFTVLGGYLGSGKTTLLNHILRHSDGHRLAVIVNDFGSISIDATLIQTCDSDAVTLANGCICCSISAGFAEALTALRRRPKTTESREVRGVEFWRGRFRRGRVACRLPG